MNISKAALFAFPAAFALLAASMLAQAPSGAASAAAGADGITITEVLPSVADPGLKTEFDQPNLIVAPIGQVRKELVLFMPGTHGTPKGDSVIIDAIASFGFRGVGLMYNDAPTGEALCRAQDSPGCLGRFREERVEGDAPDALEQNTRQEAIVHRLAALLKYEQKTHPGDGWSAYLAGDQPNWKNIIVSGHSLGSGMAAYIAQHHEVARAVLFSGPSDGVGLHPGITTQELSTHLSSWLSEPSKTPPGRWYAAYHDKELVARLSPLVYQALGVPKDHVSIFTLDPPPTVHQTGLVAYHMAMIDDPRYIPYWREMFGAGSSK